MACNELPNRGLAALGRAWADQTYTAQVEGLLRKYGPDI